MVPSQLQLLALNNLFCATWGLIERSADYRTANDRPDRVPLSGKIFSFLGAFPEWISFILSYLNIRVCDLEDNLEQLGLNRPSRLPFQVAQPMAGTVFIG